MLPVTAVDVPVVTQVVNSELVVWSIHRVHCPCPQVQIVLVQLHMMFAAA